MKTVQIVALASVLCIAIGIMWIYPASLGAVPDASWVILYEPGDLVLAERLELEFDASAIYDISGDNPLLLEFLDESDSNMIIVGGPAVGKYAPWIEPLVLHKPTGWTGAVWEGDYEVGWTLKTPKYEYPWEMVEAEDLAFIDRAYYPYNRQWVIMITGYTVRSTAVAAEYIMDNHNAMKDNNYLVLKYAGPSDISGDPAYVDWSTFPWDESEILEKG